MIANPAIPEACNHLELHSNRPSPQRATVPCGSMQKGLNR
jgi:hypothetical protein